MKGSPGGFAGIDKKLELGYIHNCLKRAIPYQ